MTATAAAITDEKKSTLEVSKTSIDKTLFEFFPPSLAVGVSMIPVGIVSKKPVGRDEHWTLKVGVAEDKVDDVQRHIEYYAEQIRDAVPTYWPKRLSLQVVATSKEEVVKRLQPLRVAWDQRLLQESLLPPPPEELFLPELPPLDPLKEAIRLMETSFTEATQTTINNISGPPPRTDQIIDLRAMDRASNRRSLQQLLHVAILKRASDIHFEYATDGRGDHAVAIRLRVDGIMQPLVECTTSLGPALLNILGKCAGSGVEDASFHMRPQDGKMIIYTQDGRRFDGRLAFTPVPVTSSSFNCVLRLLDSSQAFDFEKLDLSKRNKDTLEWAMGEDHGLIVLTGPTGSGKSSTIQACLRKIISPELKIITIEDPVEYFLRGAEQTQVNPKDPEMSFAALLRSAMRRDPDVIFLGEIRDNETADVAIKAALTGHLVFTTIHANTALEVVDRLVNLGVHRDLVASALTAVGAQRLIRRVNPERWKMAEISVSDVEKKLGIQMTKEEKDRVIRAQVLKQGFSHGDNDNYQGRIAVHQFQRFDDDLKDAIRSGKTGRELQGVARQRGLRTLMEDGLSKVQQGHTSVEEIALALQGT